jgi:hypothetical protein
MADAVQETKSPEPSPKSVELPRSTGSAAPLPGDRLESPAQARQEAEAASRTEYAKAKQDSPVRPETLARLETLRTEGHGPQLHLDPTDDKLQKRLGTPILDEDGKAVLGSKGFVKAKDHLDPETGRTTETSGTVHYCGPVSSRFTSPEDYVRAEAYLRQQAVDNHDNVAEDSIRNVLGEGAESRITGYYHDPANPGQFRTVDFTDGTILAVYDKGSDGTLGLRTMYAIHQPFKPGHND